MIDECTEKEAPKSRQTIFHEILASDLPPEEKMVHRLMQEGQVIIGAGTETTAWTLSVITYYVLANPEINKRLKAELRGLVEQYGAIPSLTRLEQLPYLSGVISEGLRLSFGVSTHLQRVCPDQEIRYEDWIIPAGVSR